MSGFKKRYLIYLGVLLLVVLSLLTALWIRMKHYQESVDAESTEAVNEEVQEVSTEDIERAAQKVFTEYADSLTLEGWVDLYYQEHPSHFDSEEDVKALITEKILNANTSRYRASDYTMDEPKYLITDGETPLFEVSLTGSEENWEITEKRLFIGGSESAVITAPSDCVLKINGGELSEEYAEVEKAAASVDGYDEELTDPVIMNTYTVSNLLNADSDVTAEGASLSIDGNFYMVADTGEDLTSRASSFIKSLLDYYASGKENTDANESEVLSYVAGGSRASAIINSAKSGLEWVTPDHSVTYSIETSEALKLADNCCLVDVSYGPEGGEDDTGVYRVYFLDEGSGYRIVLFEGIR